MEFLKRRRRLVKRGLQIAAIAYVFFIMLAILAFHTWLSYTRVAAKLPEKDRPPLVEFYVQDVIVTICFMGLFVLFMGLVGSHRFAGPVYRFEQTLKKLQKGDLSEILHLRKGDLLQDFCEELNLALANLRELVAEDRVHIAEAVGRLKELRASTQDPEQLRRIDHLVSVLRKVTTKFVLSPPALRHEEQAALEARGLAAANLPPRGVPAPMPVPAPPRPAPSGPVAPLPPPAHRQPAAAPSGARGAYAPAAYAPAAYAPAAAVVPAGAGYPGAPAGYGAPAPAAASGARPVHAPAAPSGTDWPKVHGGVPVAATRPVAARASGPMPASNHSLAQPIPPGLYPTGAAPPPPPAPGAGVPPPDGARR